MWWVHNEGFNPLKSTKVQLITFSLCCKTSSSCSSYSWLSWDEMITCFACSVSRNAYWSVDGTVLSSNVGSSIGISSKLAFSLIVITSSIQALISWSSERSMAPNSLECREGYFINLLMSIFTVFSPTQRITSPFPYFVMAFAVVRNGCPKMIGALLRSLVILMSTTKKSIEK